MKRVAVLLGMALVAPGVAQAQIPIAPAATATAPPPAAPAAAPPASSAAADAGPTPAPPAAESPAKAPPGDEYFVEQPPAERPGEVGPRPFEPPPPGAVAFYEPPPPPQIRHRAPQTSLWLGARLGWFIPFGNVWARAEPVATTSGTGYLLRGVPWSDYASSGPMFELDAGVRLSRAYTVFGLWERAQLGSGSFDTGVDGEQDGAETDFWAVGLRASSNPDHIGFLTEVAVGYRRARTFFENDVEYQFTDAPFEARLGLGAEWRLSPLASISSLLTVGVGGFGNAERVGPNGTALPLARPLDEGDGHAWATITIGGHFDLIRSKK
jgi:hypothetical protein